MRKLTLGISVFLISFSWTITSLILLIFSFDYLDTVFMEYNDIIRLLTMGITVVLAVASILYTGKEIDYHPEKLPIFTIFGFFGTIISLTFINFLTDFYGGIIGFLLLGLSLGTQTATAHIYFGVYTPRVYRSRVYGISMLLFSIISIVTIFLQGQLEDATTIFVRDEDFVKENSILLVLAFLTLVGLILIFILRKIPNYTNDSFPTAFKHIIDRDSVKSYLITHFLIYVLIGLTIQNITLNCNNFLTERIVSTLENTDLFWFLVLLGIGIGSPFSGYFTDRFGKKLPGTIGIYGIAISLLFYATNTSSVSTFLLSAFSLGIMVSLITVTFDSSIWADLSPRDALGRYFALGFSSLILGIGIGYSLGKFILAEAFSVQTVAFFLIFLAFLSAFPLFFTSDTKPPLNFQLLLITQPGGRLCFNYKFKENKAKINLGLLAGALEAVGCFMSETMDDNSKLNLVKQGSNFILAERHGKTSAALLVNKPSKEVQNRLNQFVRRFEKKYESVLVRWIGNLGVFEDANNLVEELFGPLQPSTDFEWE